MAIHLLSHIVAIYGIPHAEQGINVTNITIRYFPEVDTSFPDSVGHTRWRAVSQYFSRTVECRGEITGNTGIMAFTLGAACTFANNVAGFYPCAGTFYLDEASVTYVNRGWFGVKVKVTAKATM